MNKIKGLKSISKESIYKNRKTIIGLAFVLFVVLVGCVMLYKSQTSKVAEGPQYAASNFEEGMRSVKVTSEKSATQRLIIGNINVTAVDVMLRDLQLSEEATVKVTLVDEKTKKTLQEWHLQEDEIDSNLGSNNDKTRVTRMACDEPIALGQDRHLTINVELENAEKSDYVEVAVTETKNDLGSLFFNGKRQETGMVSAIEMDHAVNANIFAVMLTSAFLLLFVLLFLMMFKKKVGLDKVFIVMGLVCGFFYMFILNPYSVPDEPRHIETTMYFSNQLMHMDAVDEDGNALIRKDDNIFSENTLHPSIYTLSLEMQHLTDRSESDEMVSAENEPLNAPVIGYIPQILGVTLARLLHMGQVPMLLLGRFFALVFYVLVVAWAIKKIPFGKMMIFALAICPMAMQQATSFSYDVVTNALAFFFLSYCLYLAADPNKKHIDKKDFIILGITAAWLSPCKAVYVLLCFMVLIIPGSRFKTKKQKILFKGGVLLIAVLMVTAFNALSVLKLADVNRVATATYGDQELYTMGDLLKKPTDGLYLLWNTLGLDLDKYFFQMFGSTLSWLDIPVSKVIVSGYGLAALLGIFKHQENEYNPRVRDKILGALICGVVSLGIFIALLLDWTPKDSWYISGVQGRYFLPLVPIVMLIFRNNAVIIKQRFDRFLVYGVYLLQFVTLYQIIAFVVNR